MMQLMIVPTLKFNGGPICLHSNTSHLLLRLELVETIAVVFWKDSNDKPHWEYFHDPYGIVLGKVIKYLTPYQRQRAVAIEYHDLNNLSAEECRTLGAICKRI